MATNPAETFGLENKGTLEPGTDADIVVFDPSSREAIDAANNASVADHSIYQGMEVEGAVTKTLVRGTLVADDGTIIASPGHGEFIERDVPDWGD
jgi:dihydropyrimidinase